MEAISSSADNGLSAAERFFRYFQHEITALQEQMDRLGDTALIGGERKDATDHCLAGITRLSSEVKDASSAVPSYDLRTYTEAIKALQNRLAETQAQHAPKQKFSFKTKKNESAVSLHEAAQLAAEKQKSMLRSGGASGASSSATTPIYSMTPPNESASAPKSALSQSQVPEGIENDSSSKLTSESTSNKSSRPPFTTSATTTNITAQEQSHVIVPPSAAHAHSPCTISNIKSCCVDLSIPETGTSPFASLTISNVHSSLLLCGSVAGPTHITGVKNSTIAISCRQFRMHECENVDVYLYCTSRPIIEDCKEIHFAEMPNYYTDLLHSVQPTSNQAIGTNKWDSVDDFKWLRSEQSPNWMIMPGEERIRTAIWRQLIPGKPDVSLDEILRMASVET